MTEERLDRIERRLDGLASEMAEVKSDLAEVKTGLAEVKTDMTHVKSEVTELRTEMILFKDDLSREMRFLFEQTNENIKALALPVPELERRWKADDAALREDVGRRLDPLEAIVRKHFGT